MEPAHTALFYAYPEILVGLHFLLCCVPSAVLPFKYKFNYSIYVTFLLYKNTFLTLLCRDVSSGLNIEHPSTMQETDNETKQNQRSHSKTDKDPGVQRTDSKEQPHTSPTLQKDQGPQKENNGLTPNTLENA